VLATFTPRPPLQQHWAQLQPVALEIMARSRVRGPSAFRKNLTHVGYFLLWASQQGLPVTAETLTRAHTDEYTRIGMPHTAEKSRSDRRARLRWLADQVNPHQAPDRGVTVARPSVKAPYTETELTQLIRVALSQPTREKARHAALCIGLGAGAGLDGPDLRGLRAEHITDEDGKGLTVHVPGAKGRTVPVLRRFEPLVRRGVTGIEPGQLLLGHVPDRRNITGNALSAVVALGHCPRLEQSRLRSTWLVTLLAEAVPLGILLEAAGLRSARTLPDLLAYLPPADPELWERSLRGTAGSKL
jgi:hypothetical protein